MISEALVRFYLANRSEIDNFFQCRLDEVNTLMRMCMPVLTELCRLLLEIGVNVLGLGNLAVHTLAIPMEVISRFAYDRSATFNCELATAPLHWRLYRSAVALAIWRRDPGISAIRIGSHRSFKP
ncbi:uncharacterized protein LOC128221108 isoform X1 [Mya arenaria]|uniref:uncharacterized protein LOC128221108 isoform X1 n=1 Tax=Mya arenaria TaxID=6604 RepID=UPI0022E4DD58|nr:uncharacterized protein LOC128221108 isoform X1 [Mya arenaria]